MAQQNPARHDQRFSQVVHGHAKTWSTSSFWVAVRRMLTSRRFPASRRELESSSIPASTTTMCRTVMGIRPSKFRVGSTPIFGVSGPTAYTRSIFMWPRRNRPPSWVLAAGPDHHGTSNGIFLAKSAAPKHFVIRTKCSTSPCQLAWQERKFGQLAQSGPLSNCFTRPTSRRGVPRLASGIWTNSE